MHLPWASLEALQVKIWFPKQCKKQKKRCREARVSDPSWLRLLIHLRCLQTGPLCSAMLWLCDLGPQFRRYVKQTLCTGGSSVPLVRLPVCAQEREGKAQSIPGGTSSFSPLVRRKIVLLCQPHLQPCLRKLPFRARDFSMPEGVRLI